MPPRTISATFNVNSWSSNGSVPDPVIDETTPPRLVTGIMTRPICDGFSTRSVWLYFYSASYQQYLIWVDCGTNNTTVFLIKFTLALVFDLGQVSLACSLFWVLICLINGLFRVDKHLLPRPQWMQSHGIYLEAGASLIHVLLIGWLNFIL